MGADVKQTGEAFEASQKYLRWQDREANQALFLPVSMRSSPKKRLICCWKSAS